MAAAPCKVALVIIDGIGDVTIPAFGDRTPLEMAHTPNMDALAAAGLNGLMDPVEPGLACGSDTAHMSILGYDPRKYYRGRGAFESMGAGLPMAPGDIAFKSNFATLNTATGIVGSRRADRNFEHLGPALCEALDGLRLPSFPEHAISVRYATEHRCGVVVRGRGLSDAITGTDPLKDNRPLLEVQPTDDSPEAAQSAAVVNELSQEMQKVLAHHPINAERIAQGLNPANVVLLRGCGSRINVPSFEELHHMRPCLVAPTKIIAGLGMSLDIEALEAPGARGDYFSALHAKADTIASALTTGGFSFGLLHVKAVDDTGHDRMAAMKVKFMEAVDVMIGQLVAHLAAAEQQQQPPARYCLCVTGDHSTPVVFGDHSHEPVPFAVAHISDIATAMGGEAQLALRRPGEPISMPDTKAPPPLEQLLADAASQAARRAAAATSKPFDANAVASSSQGGPKEGQGGFGRWPEAWPQAHMWDGVCCFDEISAARGALGRFPGSEVMTLLKRFAGMEVVT